MVLTLSIQLRIVPLIIMVALRTIDNYGGASDEEDEIGLGEAGMRKMSLNQEHMRWKRCSGL